ncbi:cytochrome b [Pelistega suis]|uniref:Cytochrome b n=1 Tax=Pelistega suis TaxID=1631957 RepID=A0A849P4X0_9BURK|nr:cytochrome b [Pelistega suis]NOL51394.1 cytochrome b [Pelistega suis]
MSNSAQGYGKVAIVLHWLIAVVMIGMICLGLYINKNEAYHLMSTHKSVGILIFVFVVWRLLLRLLKGFLPALGSTSTFQQILSRLVHWILLLGTVLFPLSGMVMSAMGGRGLQVFGTEIFPMNMLNGRPAAINEDVSEMAANIHELLVPIMIAAIALHILGVIYHQFIVKDNTLSRMLGCTKCHK